MYLPKLELAGWDEYTVEERKISLRSLCEHFITHNMIWLRKHRPFPALYDIGPRYVMKVRPNMLDAWQDIPQTIRLGSGDCKDFVNWEAARLRMEGIDDVYPYITDSTFEDQTGQGRPSVTLYHVRLRVHDWIEDPSAKLGMPSATTYDEIIQ